MVIVRWLYLFYSLSIIVGNFMPDLINTYDFLVNSLQVIILKQARVHCLHTVKWFQALLCNTESSICFHIDR